MIILGLDIGSNSVGSAWIDTDRQEIVAGANVFPAGVDESDDQRGAPKNQDRRGKRSLRRTLARRSKRKRLTRQILTEYGLLPDDPDEQRRRFSDNPWPLRRRGIELPLTAHEFGRVLVHLGQRRGALGVDADAEDEGEVKKAIDTTRLALLKRYATPEERDRLMALHDGDDKDDFSEAFHRWLKGQPVTYGRLMADLMDERRHEITDESERVRTGPAGDRSHYHDPIRNQHQAFEFHADRAMIRDEFLRLWQRQSREDGALAHLSEQQREELRHKLDDPTRDGTWRHKGAIFGQRDTYWDTGTLGRCDLEPTDRCAPIADRYASYFRVLETVNNIRLQGPDDRQERPLTADERDKVIARLRKQKTGSVATVRKALGIDKQSLRRDDLPEDSWSLNLERDEGREINTDWFYRDIVLGAVGETLWTQWAERAKEGLNRALLKCDPKIDDDADRLRAMVRPIGLDDDAIERLVEAWKRRPKLEKRLNISRKAVQNLLPYMEQPRTDGRWLTQIEARRAFAEDGDNHASDEQRRRYRIGAQTVSKADRQYLAKHPDALPPAPTLSNPVVRKAIHEVRRHVIAHMRAHNGCKPDRICIEFAREATKPKKLSDRILWLNRNRERIRKSIAEEVIKPVFGDRFHSLSNNQLESAIDRVILARQQKHRCAYSGTKHGSITERVAALGDGLEIDHIIPRARGGRNDWSNRVLCWEKSNRDKGRNLPRQWWGDRFDEFARPMSFMDGHVPDLKDPNEYFTKRDYAAKWENFAREDVPKEWRGSQLTDTAYAARQVQSYLQSALWPDERSHLEGGQRRIFVTKGAYTHQLRKDWQLFQTLINSSEQSHQEVREHAAKNRGDHREHAVDAVAVAFMAEPARVARNANGHHPSTRLDDLAHHQQAVDEERLTAKSQGRDRREIKRQPLPPPWGSVTTFRRQVMSAIYPACDRGDGEAQGREEARTHPLVVAHRPVGRRIIGKFHEDTLFGPVPGAENTYIGRKSVVDLKPAHLRLPRPETKQDSIRRLTQHYLDNGVESTKRKAKQRAEAEVESPGFTPPIVDPPPEKSGLVRDRGLRRRLRQCIESFEYTEKDRDGNVTVRRYLDPDNFTQKEIKQAYEAGAICHKSGVPIKRVKLLRTMADPVVIPRKRWDERNQRWVRDTGKDGSLTPDDRSRADRAYVGGNNHHIEIRESDRGKWSGVIVSMFDAARRVRIQKRDAVDRADDAEKGGRFIMSLAEGETVYMKHKDSDEPGYFVVFKLDKPQKIQFKHHWDARRAKGEKDDDGNVIPETRRDEMPVSATQLRDLAPPGYDHPVKVDVSPIGEVTVLDRD